MIPIACTLDAGEARERWQQWQSLARTVGKVDRVAHGLSLHFTAADDTRSELVRLVGAERQCCGFVDWQLEELGDELVLTISGDPDGVEAMVESFRLPT
ncbi:MAG TPA: hypothetical protein VM848_08580 [Acidimicrobiia bacterium]|nr:hypothetical protein [Acidimicrobiia bacterium]